MNTDTFDCLVTVARDGKEIRRVKMDTDVAPLSEKTYALPVPEETRGGRVHHHGFLPSEGRSGMGESRT